MTVPQPTPPKKPRIGCGSVRRAHDVTLGPSPWPASSYFIPPRPLLWVSTEVLRISNEPEESPRSPGGDEIVGPPRVAFRMPRPGGGRVTSGKLRLERKVGHHEYVPSAPQSSDPVQWFITQTKYLWTGFHLVPDSWLYSQYNPKYTTFKCVWHFWDTRYIGTVPGHVINPSLIRYLRNGKFICIAGQILW